MVYPPRPSNITIPAVVAGNILQSDDTSVSVVDSGNDGSIVMRTQNQLAMIINPSQQTMINTQAATGMLNVNSNVGTTPVMRLSYQDNRYFDMLMSNTGIRLSPSADDPLINEEMATEFDHDVNIDDHDGGTHGLRLHGILVTAAASELNFVDVAAGSAQPMKALVLDSSRNISGINRLNTTQISGTLLTAAQPNITTLQTINITDSLSIRGVPLSIDLTTLQYLQLPNHDEGIGYASKAVILNQNRSVSNINNLSATTISGTLTTGPQPNITSLSALSSLTNAGTSSLLDTVSIITSGNDQLRLGYSGSVFSTLTTNSYGDLVLTANSAHVKIDGGNLQVSGHNGSTAGLILGNNLVVATAAHLNATAVTAGSASAFKALVLDINRNISGINDISASHIAATITVPSQPFITTVSTLNVANHNGIVGLSLGGVLITATGDKLNYVDTTPGTAQASKALILGPSGGIAGIGALSANTLSGTLLTAAQPYISSVATLNVSNHNGTVGLALGGTVVTASAANLNTTQVAAGVAAAGKALVLNSSRSVSGIGVLTADSLAGVLLTSAQPNLSQVNIMNVASHDGSSAGLSLGGVLVTATATELNYLDVVPGQALAKKALVLDSAGSITNINTVDASYLHGLITTAVQPNISQVNSLNVANHNGATAGLALGGELITVSASQINALNVGAGIAAAGRVLIVDGGRSISNINALSAITLTGELQTGNQPKISSVNVLNVVNHDGSSNGLSLSGNLVKASAEQLNYLTIDVLGQAQAGRALTTNIARSVEGINLLSATSLAGVLVTSEQPNLQRVNTLNVANHNGTVGLALAGTIITASANQINRVDANVGTAQEGKVLIVDTQRSISNINNLSATTLSGTIQTADQPYITKVTTLNVSNHDGGSTGLQLRGAIVAATAAQLNYTVVVPGTASSSRALVTDAYNSIGGINNLTAQQITASKLLLSGIVSNFNTGALVIRSYSFTNLIGRTINTQLLSSLSFSSFTPADGITSGYSCEITGYLLPPSSQNYTFQVLCNDRVRVWVNGVLVLHSWSPTTLTRTSSAVFLNANQWVPVYIQYQVDVGSAQLFSMQWSSGSFTSQAIQSSQLAWDNKAAPAILNACSQDSLTIYNTNTNAQSLASLTVDTAGDLTIDASGNDVSLGTGDNLNIPSHNGTTSGLMLAGVLVQPTAYELNYLKVNPGVVSASHALVVDASKSLSGLGSLQASSIACSNLSSDNFSIGDLTLAGPLNNYNVGALLIRQITGPNAGGRVVSVDTIADLRFNSYDPRGLNLNYTIDICGYLRPMQSDLHRFYATASGYVRMWVNDVLIINACDQSTNIEYTSSAVSLQEGQWVSFYVQLQNISTISTPIASALQIQWSSPLMTKQFISSANMAWDNTSVKPPRAGTAADRLSVFSSSSGLAAPTTGAMSVDITGTLKLSGSGGTVAISSANDLNIVSHNGTNGLRLSGALVKATATELNYLQGAAPGTAAANKAVILSDSGQLVGFTLLGGASLSGTLITASQPNITAIGTLSTTLNSTSDIVLANSNYMRLSADASACYLQAGTSNTTNAAADIFVGNYGASIAASSRKLMIKANGNVGIQTSAPTRALTVNGGGATYCARLVNNSAAGSDTNFMDIGVDTSSNLVLGSTGSGSATIGVSQVGVMRIVPSGGTLQVGNASNTAMPLEVGSANYTVSSTVGYLNSSGSAGVVVPTDVSYSMRTSGSIIVTGTVCVTSDRRLKRDISSLDVAACRRFIEESDPVSFRYSSDERWHCGLIAQSVATSTFPHLVTVAPHEGLAEDSTDGFVSPADAALNVSYEEVVPILMTVVRDMAEENRGLRKRLDALEQLVSKMLGQ